jgi:hypothetical protein
MFPEYFRGFIVVGLVAVVESGFWIPPCVHESLGTLVLSHDSVRLILSFPMTLTVADVTFLPNVVVIVVMPVSTAVGLVVGLVVG